MTDRPRAYVHRRTGTRYTVIRRYNDIGGYPITLVESDGGRQRRLWQYEINDQFDAVIEDEDA